MTSPLPEDILVAILSKLHPRDIFLVRQVSKPFLALTQLRQIWIAMLSAWCSNIPIPGLRGQATTSLSSDLLELAVVRALHGNIWISAAPTPQYEICLKGIEQGRRARIVGLHFLSYRLLWSVAVGAPVSGTRLRRVEIRAWDIEAKGLEDRLLGLVNEDVVSWRVEMVENVVPRLILLRDNSKVEIWELSDRHGFVRILEASFPNTPLARLLAFRKSVVVAELASGVTCILDLANQGRYFMLQNPQLTQASIFLLIYPCHEIHLTDDSLIQATTKSVEVYSLVPLSQSTSTSPVLQPISQHSWQWSVDSLALAYRPCAPLSILLRWATYYPWPVNMLHHYVLPRDPANVFSDDKLLSSPLLTEAPSLLETIGAPVRLLAPYSMSLGSRGTLAVWIDTQTEEYFQHSDSGQRVVGCVLGQTMIDGDPATRTGDILYDVSESDKWVKVEVDQEERRLAVADEHGGIVIRCYY
ncbi:hypothetical protein DL96DRAFT_1705299 [Flagelloscypha sp. PMI_526]|nr:hypothetical protein DL96DRAFT_1705299 [Flagelloscypha sp. PMI_526]